MSTDEALRRALLEVSLDWAACAPAGEQARRGVVEEAVRRASEPRRREACRSLALDPRLAPLGRDRRRG